MMVLKIQITWHAFSYMYILILCWVKSILRFYMLNMLFFVKHCFRVS